MTRILFTTAPMAAHVRPTVPLVAELASAGHHVTWYTGPEFTSMVRAAGAEPAPANVTVDFPAALRRTGGRGGAGGLNALVLELFLKPIPAYIDDLAAVFDRARPDVVVSDHSFRPGLMLAEQRGVPRVAFSAGPLNLSSADVLPFGLGRPPIRLPGRRLIHRALRWWWYGIRYRERQRVLAAARARLTLPELDGYSVDWVVRTCDRYLQSGVPEFEYPRRDLPPNVEFVGAVQPTSVDSTPVPSWWHDVERSRAQGRSIVFVTQGTIATDLDNLVVPAARALAGTDALVVASSSGQDPAVVQARAGDPGNLRVAPFVPYDRLLPLIDVMVTNGGYGGVQTALSHGVPLVVCGTSEDRMETNARVAWTGTGLSLRTDRPRPDRLARAVHRVLTDPSFRRAAGNMRRAFACYTGSERAAAAVLRVAHERSGTETPIHGERDKA